MGSSPGAANFFLIWRLILGIVYGAKVGLKLRLRKDISWCNDSPQHQFWFVFHFRLNLLDWVYLLVCGSHCQHQSKHIKKPLHRPWVIKGETRFQVFTFSKHVSSFYTQDLIFFKALFEQIGGSVEVIVGIHTCSIPKHFFICQSVTYYHISRLLQQVSAGWQWSCRGCSLKFLMYSTLERIKLIKQLSVAFQVG